MKRLPVHPDADTTAATVAGELVTFSIGFTGIIDDAMGTDFAGNREIRALVTLLRGPCTTAELTSRSGLSRRTVNRMLARLTADSLVSTTAWDLDRRAVLVETTSTGQARGQRMQKRLDRYMVDATPSVHRIVELLGTDTTTQESADQEPDTLTLVDMIATVGIQLGDAVTARTHGPGVTGRQQLALVHITSSEQTRPRDLVDALGVTSASVTSLVDKLAGAGLVVRHYGARDDHRAVVITATPLGREVASTLDHAIEDCTDALRDLFTAIARRSDS